MEEISPNKPRIKLARDTARKILVKANISTYPILLKKISEHVDNLYIDGREFEDGLSGVSARYNGKIFIAYNKDHAMVRNRFTVAHELGHVLLGHTERSVPVELNSKDYYECEANQFAAELIMPLTLLKNAIKKYRTVGELAYAFWVSKEAMGWRVMETGTFKFLDSWS